MDWNDHAKKQQQQKSAEEFFQKFLNDPGLFLKTIIGLLVIGTVLTSFYTVKPEEKAVVTRLGGYIDTAPPGLHFKLPFGIDRVQKVETSVVHEESFGFYQALQSNRPETSNPFARPTRRFARDLNEESLMLTGDLNVADVHWVVQYRINDPKQYLFQVADPVKNIRDISQAAMRRVVGDKTVNDVLTTGRSQIGSDAKSITQQILSDYEMGVEILAVKLQDVNPPEEVKPSFNAVNAARQIQRQLINTAESEYNKVIPKAKGEKEQTIEQARGYADAIVNRARGDAEKFKRILGEYQKAPELTRTRMYIDVIQNLMTRVNSFTVVDPDIKGVLPVLGNLAGTNSRSEARASLRRPDEEESNTRMAPPSAANSSMNQGRR